MKRIIRKFSPNYLTKKELKKALKGLEKQYEELERLIRVQEKNYNAEEYKVDNIERRTVYKPEVVGLEEVKREMTEKILEAAKHNIDWNYDIESKHGKVVKATLKVLRR